LEEGEYATDDDDEHQQQREGGRGGGGDAGLERGEYSIYVGRDGGQMTQGGGSSTQQRTISIVRPSFGGDFANNKPTPSQPQAHTQQQQQTLDNYEEVNMDIVSDVSEGFIES
jgi:hypothetical protein